MVAQGYVPARVAGPGSGVMSTGSGIADPRRRSCAWQKIDLPKENVVPVSGRGTASGGGAMRKETKADRSKQTEVSSGGPVGPNPVSKGAHIHRPGGGRT